MSDRRSSGRERLVLVLVVLALGGVVVLASTQVFSTVVPVDGRPVPVTGQGVAPALAPLGIVLIALAGALTIAGRIARVVLGLVLVLLGALVVLLTLPNALDPSAGTRGAVSTATGVIGHVTAVAHGGGWPVRRRSGRRARRARRRRRAAAGPGLVDRGEPLPAVREPCRAPVGSGRRVGRADRRRRPHPRRRPGPGHRPSRRDLRMANITEDPGHGSSPAAWIAVVIMLVGVAIGTLFLFLEVLPLVYVGAVLIPIGLIVGYVLKKAGFGVGGSRVGSSH